MDSEHFRPPPQPDSGETSSVSTIERPPDTPDIPQSKQYHPYSFAVLALLVPSSLLGLLARLGIQALVSYEGQTIFSLSYVQSIGCLVMGICLHCKDRIGHTYAPFYTALATGFCGSLTTFSGWQYDVFISWLNPSHYHRHGLQSFIDGVGKSTYTIALSVASIFVGRIIGQTLDAYPFPLACPTKLQRYMINVLSIAMLIATIPAYILMSANYRHQATAALLFAFPGTLSRYILSTELNRLNPSFPIGTFLANSVGTALLGGFHVLQGTSVGPRVCGLLQGLEDGLCGCLTTVSTFAVELHTLRRRDAVLYGGTSWIVGQLLLLVVLGPSFWSARISENIVCSFER